VHRRQTLSLLQRITPVAVATALLLTGCSSTVEVAAPDAADHPACADVAWPEEISGHARVGTTPEAPWVAAWGDPAIIARCGLPAMEPTTLDCVGVDDIDWIVKELDGGTAMVTYSTDPALEVLVPDTYGPGPLLLPAFTDIARSLPQTGQECT